MLNCLTYVYSIVFIDDYAQISTNTFRPFDFILVLIWSEYQGDDI